MKKILSPEKYDDRVCGLCFNIIADKYFNTMIACKIKSLNEKIDQNLQKETIASVEDKTQAKRKAKKLKKVKQSMFSK